MSVRSAAEGSGERALQRPLVSVIMPFLNCAPFIEEAIESVFPQTYDNWELVLVDDGSTDASTEIAKRHAARLPDRVRYLEHDGHSNRGASASRNLGIRHAEGRYMAFLDADDVWLPEILERHVSLLESHPSAAMVYGPAQIWRSWTGKVEDVSRDSLQSLDVPTNRLYEPPTLLPHFLRNDGATPCPGSVLIRGDVVRRVGGFEDAFRGAYDDQAFYAKICLTDAVFVSSVPYLRYRRHADSVCANMFRAGEYHAKRLAFLTWLETYLRAHGRAAGEVWAVLRQQLWSYRHPRLARFLRFARRSGSTLESRMRALARPIVPAATRSRLRARGRRPG